MEVSLTSPSSPFEHQAEPLLGFLSLDPVAEKRPDVSPFPSFEGNRTSALLSSAVIHHSILQFDDNITPRIYLVSGTWTSVGAENLDGAGHVSIICARRRPEHWALGRRMGSAYSIYINSPPIGSVWQLQPQEIAP